MTFASNPDADPDPTTQMTWPSSRRNASGSHIIKANYPGGAVESPQAERGPLRLDPTISGIKTLVNPSTKRSLTTKDLIFLTISMAGAQIAWTVELGYVLHSVSVSTSVAFGCRHFDMLPGAYGIHSQIWDTFLVELGSVGATHVFGVVGGPH